MEVDWDGKDVVHIDFERPERQPGKSNEEEARERMERRIRRRKARERMEKRIEKKKKHYMSRINNYKTLAEAHEDLRGLTQWYIENKEYFEEEDQDGFSVVSNHDEELRRIIGFINKAIVEKAKDEELKKMKRDELENTLQQISYDSLMVPLPSMGKTFGGRTRRRKRRRKRKTRKRKRKKSRKKRKRRRRRTRK